MQGSGCNSSTCQWIFSSHEHITMPSREDAAKVRVAVNREKSSRNGGSQDEHEVLQRSIVQEK